MQKTLAALGLVSCAVGAYRVHFHWASEPGISAAASLADDGYRKLWQGSKVEAVDAFRRALIADAGSPYRWADLGSAYLESGDNDKARYCFEQARARSPRSPQILIRSANFALATGARADLVRDTAVLLEVVSTYDDTAFRLWRQAEIPPAEALTSAIKGNRRAHEAYFRHLLRTSDLAGAAAVWRELPNPGIELTAEYAETLVSAGDPAAAAGAHARGSGVSAIVVNGGFDADWTGKGLDWRVIPLEGVDVAREDGALKIGFVEAENIEYRHMTQRVWIPAAGVYRLHARMRSESLTTDQGVALRLSDGNSEIARTVTLSGSVAWREERVTFAAGGPRLVRLEVYRAKSWKFDGKPRGRVWIDDVRIEPGS